MRDWLADVDWEQVFVPSTPLLELVVRGSIMYLALLALLRFVTKREAGAIGITDLLVVVLIADAAQNAMADDYRSIPDGLILVGTIVFWDWALNWLGYRVPLVERIVNPAPLQLVKDGRMLRRNMKKVLITEDELLSHLREQGIADLSQVAAAYLEGDGHISVIEREAKRHEAEERPVG